MCIRDRLYVDHHDEAYRWAEKRRLAINPVTGAMQMVVLESVFEAAPVAPAKASIETPLSLIHI